MFCKEHTRQCSVTTHVKSLCESRVAKINTDVVRSFPGMVGEQRVCACVCYITHTPPDSAHGLFAHVLILLFNIQ